jgi:hypothetical protein
MSNMISPSYADTKFANPSIDDLVDVFEDRIRHWLLQPAKRLKDTEHGQVASFCLILTYFEGIWSYIEGRGSRGRSREFFEKGFVEVFRTSNLKEKLLRRVAAILYTDARCGFFHDGMFRERISFTSLQESEMLLTLPKKGGQVDENGQVQSLLIDPRNFYSAVERHFERNMQGFARRSRSNVTGKPPGQLLESRSQRVPRHRLLLQPPPFMRAIAMLDALLEYV